MMKKNKQKLSILILAVVFVIAAIFGCVLASKGTFMVHDNSSPMLSTCCSGNIFNLSSHNIPLILVNSIIFQLLLLAVISLYLFIKNDNSAREYVLKNYFRTRDRYGGFTLFNYFISLFRQGILHPKIY